MAETLSSEAKSYGTMKPTRIIVRASPQLMALTKHAADASGLRHSVWLRRALERAANTQLRNNS